MKKRANAKRKSRTVGAKHPDGSYITVSKRKDGRWSGYYYELDVHGNLDRSKRHNLCNKNRDALIAQIVERETLKEPTLREAITAWERVHWENVSRNTISAYRAPVRRVLEKFGDRPLSSITTTEVSGFLAELGNMGYARQTVQLHRNALSMAYEYAILNGLTEHSPVDHAVTPRNLPQSKREPLTDEQIAAVENGLDKPFGLFGYLLLYSGLRRGEALALRYEDIDRKNKLIRVTKTLEFDGGRPYIKEPKTKTSVRNVPLTDPLADAIPLGIGYIFHQDGKPDPLIESQFASRWRRYCDAIGFSLTPHQFRHTYATILYSLGVGAKEAQGFLGHANIQITMDIYTHIGAALESQAAAKINDYAKRNRDGNPDGKNAVSV